ncbi:VanZ family protein [Pseudarthrobacter sulfonivorans]|uniref:VanZ family protein n=1 Tax=Pseudarthrobacter sulfonivorans TaxID=121292 RepID=UPI0027836148|nr:VanZ family protein [Pseudarthrobacter sulfonivorans]MDQ0000844.1 glycopeptide antibiotics resistance protein [Pseudarthrobacter sulfonivorans]
MTYLEQHRIWRATLAGTLIPLALIAFWPSPVDAPVKGQLASVLKCLHTHGMPTWFNYKFVEASANVGLFIPLGAVAVLAFADKHWWQVGALGLIISGCMELGQILFLHNRFASPLDLVTNTAGAVIGALLAASLHRRLRARRLSTPGP